MRILNKNLSHISCFAIFLIILTIFTFPLIFKMNNAVYGPLYGTDNRSAIWHFWWFNFSHKNNLDVQTNIFTNHPFGVKNMEPRIFPLCSMPTYLLSIVFNEIFAYNSLMFLSFVLAFLFMYILVFYLTKNSSAAFISGLTYSLSPYHFNKSWEHFGLTFIEFIPLYVYFLLKLKEKPNIKFLLLCSSSLVFVILSDLTYSYLVFILSVFYISFCIFYYCRNKNGFDKFIVLFWNFTKMGLLSIFISVPLFFSSVKEIFHSTSNLVSKSSVLVRSFNYLFSQSASILAYVVPSKYNPLLGGLARSLEGSIFFGRGPVEQTLYLGWIPLILAWSAWKRRPMFSMQEAEAKKEHFYIRLLVFIAIGGVIFSMPPYFNLGLFKIYFPSFFMYKILPMFRAYARFGLLAILSVSILAGFGLKYFLQKLKTPKRRLAFTVLITCLILWEFNNIPPFRVTNINNPPAVYKWLVQQKGDFVIAEYPLGEANKDEGYVELDYLLYQRFHQKKIINGALPGTEAYRIKNKIKNITHSQTANILKWLGVRYVVVHYNRYKNSRDTGAIDILGDIPDLSKSKGLKFKKKFGNDEVYEVVAEPLKP